MILTLFTIFKDNIGNFILGETQQNSQFTKVSQMATLSPSIATHNPQAYYDGQSPYPSLSGFHDYEPQLEFDDAELLERKQEEDEEDGMLDKNNFVSLYCHIYMYIGYEDAEIPAAICNTVEREYLESPMMPNGTIEEDFEAALAKEVAAAGALGSPETPVVNSKMFEGLKESTIIDFIKMSL